MPAARHHEGENKIDMETNRLPRCPGTVVIHRDLAVSCTSESCRWDLPQHMWYELHANVVRCADAEGGSGCPLCGFRHVVRPDADPWRDLHAVQ
jgi:hypothetical protein